MKILMLHNKYLIPGGEDISTLNEAKLLRDGGHEVKLIQVHNDEVEKIGRVRTSIRSIWSLPAMRMVDEELRGANYDILHVQNNFPLLSPAVLRVAHKHGVTSIQALRNYRLLCSKAQLFRDGKSCTDCLGKFIPWDGIKHGCYHDSRAGSAVIAAMIGVHKTVGTWSHMTDAFISVSEHVRQRYIQGGFPPDQVHAKPNVVAAPAREMAEKKRQFVYIGRLSEEKGLHTLVDAWRMRPRDGRLVFIGSGPLAEELRARCADDETIVFTGQMPSEQAMDIVAESMCTIIPSEWEEPFPRTAVESLAVGTPVFGAASGGINNLFVDDTGGALFAPGNAQELASLIDQALAEDGWAQKMSAQAVHLFKSVYAPEALLVRTESIYTLATKRHRDKHD